MLIINQLYKICFESALLLLFLLISCTGKTPQENIVQTIETDSADFYQQAEDKAEYDYRAFRGIYDHESTTKGFSAVLTLTESGNDLSFTLSVSQGNCKGEAVGKIFIVSHEENYYVGFFELDECPLQFSLLLRDTKIDVKEVNVCKLHPAQCSFEGTYTKRKT